MSRRLGIIAEKFTIEKKTFGAWIWERNCDTKADAEAMLKHFSPAERERYQIVKVTREVVG